MSRGLAMRCVLSIYFTLDLMHSSSVFLLLFAIHIHHLNHISASCLHSKTGYSAGVFQALYHLFGSCRAIFGKSILNKLVCKIDGMEYIVYDHVNIY